MASKEQIEEFLQNEGLLFQLTDTIHNEIMDDDEPFDKVARNLLNAYEQNPDIVDDVLMSLCGWTMESLMQQI